MLYRYAEQVSGEGLIRAEALQLSPDKGRCVGSGRSDTIA